MELVIERRAIAEKQILDRCACTRCCNAPTRRVAYVTARTSTLTLDRLVPVSTLDSIEAAVQLILEHRERRILVVGDFDADGATSTALIVRCLRAWGFATVDFLVPNRFEFGYGLTPEIVGLAALRAPTLIVTVDNGISSNRGRRRGAARGIRC
jgi:single-stranded-DNA-specific exonuclease